MSHYTIIAQHLQDSGLTEAEQWHLQQILQEAPDEQLNELEKLVTEDPELVLPVMRNVLAKGHALASADDAEWEEVISGELIQLDMLEPSF